MLGSIISGIGSVIGGIFGQNSQEDQIQAQIDAQKQFAQNGIRWRVEDATKAGIHPLYALGANTTSFSPIGVGGNPLGEGIAAASQDIGRAISAKGTSVERAFNAKVMQLQLQRGELENAPERAENSMKHWERSVQEVAGSKPGSKEKQN